MYPIIWLLRLGGAIFLLLAAGGLILTLLGVDVGLLSG
jgi:hypothetical protein